MKHAKSSEPSERASEESNTNLAAAACGALAADDAPVSALSPWRTSTLCARVGEFEEDAGSAPISADCAGAPRTEGGSTTNSALTTGERHS